MTDTTVLAGCHVRVRSAHAPCGPVDTASHHARVRYLERIEGLPAEEHDFEAFRRADRELMRRFRGHTLGGIYEGGAEGDEDLAQGGTIMHAGRVHVVVRGLCIVTVLPRDHAIPGCDCKACARMRRRRLKQYRLGVTRSTRDGIRLELEQKRPTKTRQMWSGSRNAGRTRLRGPEPLEV